MDEFTLRDIIQWERIGCIIVHLAKRLDVSNEEALDLFYESETCARLHDTSTDLYLYGDLYIVDEMMLELQRKQG